jgi:transcription initiation factor TFIIB
MTEHITFDLNNIKNENEDDDNDIKNDNDIENDDIWNIFDQIKDKKEIKNKIIKNKIINKNTSNKNPSNDEDEDKDNNDDNILINATNTNHMNSTPKCTNCPDIDLIQTDGLYVCPQCCMINDNVIDETPEWRYYGADDNKSVNPTRCGMPTNEFYSEASLGSNISIGGATSYEMWRVAWYHNCNIMNYKERNFHEYISLMNNYASQADIPGCVIKEAENIYKSIIDYRTSVGLHEFRHPTREAVLASCIKEACQMNDCPRSAAEMAEIFHMDRSVFVTGHKEFKKYWDIVQRQNQNITTEESKLSIPSDYINRFCSRLNLGNDFRKICRQICTNISEKNIVPKYVAVSIVAGVIYLVNNLFNLGMKKKQISKICDNVSEATIHKCYLDLNNSLEHIVPQYVLEEIIKKNF